MPYSSVQAAEKKIPSIKNLTASQKKKFLKIFNGMIGSGMEESKAIPAAITQAKKVNKSMDEFNKLIMKATVDDNKNYLRDAIKKKYEVDYCWCVTYDDDYVYFHAEKYDDGEYTEGMFRVSYSLDGVNATVGDDLAAVVSESTFTVVNDQEIVNEFIGEKMMKSLRSLFKEYFGDKNKEISKNLVDEKMIAYDPIYSPPNTPDGESEGMTEEEIEKAVNTYKKRIDEGTAVVNLFHKVPTKSVSAIDCFVNKWPDGECVVNGTPLAKGQGVVVFKYHNKKAWDLRKKGVLKGPSIEGIAGKKRKVSDE